MKITSGLLLAVIMVTSLPSIAMAADVLVRPFLLDEVVSPREIVSREITLTNQTGSKQVVFATVNEISVDGAGEIKEFVSPIMTDRTNTVASWVEVTRGRIELEPGEVKTVPVTFRIHPQAQTGDYHVFLGFVGASKRYEAEAIALRGEADGVIAKLSIASQAEEFLRISSFSINRFVVTDKQREVSLDLENLGDVPATPTGEVVFFNSLGEELTAVPVNDGNTTIAPGETATLKLQVPVEGTLGRYKANLTLEYGEAQRATLYDTTQFFLMPLHLLILLLVGFLSVALLIVLLLKKALHRDDDEHTEIELPLYVKDGHEAKPKDHDIDLKNKTS